MCLEGLNLNKHKNLQFSSCKTSTSFTQLHVFTLNTLWEIGLPSGNMEKYFKDIVGVGKSKIQALLKDLDNANIEEVTKVVRLFPKKIHERINEEF